MRIFVRRIVFGSLAALGLALCGGRLLMAAPTYAITATNVTMPRSGNGVTNYTVSGIPMKGTLAVRCAYSGPKTMAHIPTCTYGPLFVQNVDAGQTVAGSIRFYPYGEAVPVDASSEARRGYYWPVGGVVAAGLLLGLRFRRKAPRWLAGFLLMAGLAGAVAMAGCGGGGNGMTPGTYAYTVSADNEAQPNTPIGAGVSTTISVIIP
jgi:hypothetical protein